MAELPKVAYVFPGQGSQSTGMGLDLYNSYPSAKEVFAKADASLGFPLSRLCFEGPEEELKKTHNVQPAILVVSIACLRALEESAIANFPSPTFVAGHSLGEYTALVAAGVLGLTDAVLLVRERGRLMYEAGAAQALVEADKLARVKGARALRPLKVSGAFHSALIQPVLAEFSRIVSNVRFQPPVIPVISNVTARSLTDVDSIKEELVKQLRNCIQWQRSVEYMMHSGITTFYEIGPGRVLTGLIRRINSELQIFNISGVEDIAQLAYQEGRNN
jgi:[acyl-carrier-protein] S-malonyltransferase